MASLQQRKRMGALRSALGLLRQRQFTTGYSLVVLGGACAPSTKIDTSNFDNLDSDTFDLGDFISPPLVPGPCAPPGRHLVVPGGAAALSPPYTYAGLTLGLKNDRLSRRNFHARTRCIDTLALVVPGRFRLWHRTGIGWSPPWWRSTP